MVPPTFGQHCFAPHIDKKMDLSCMLRNKCFHQRPQRPHICLGILIRVEYEEWHLIPGTQCGFQRTSYAQAQVLLQTRTSTVTPAANHTDVLQLSSVQASNCAATPPAPSLQAPANSTAQDPLLPPAPSPDIACKPPAAHPPAATPPSTSCVAESAPAAASAANAQGVDDDDKPLVTLVAPGSAGDVFPLLAVGHHLHRLGLRCVAVCVAVRS